MQIAILKGSSCLPTKFLTFRISGKWYQQDLLVCPPTFPPSEYQQDPNINMFGAFKPSYLLVRIALCQHSRGEGAETRSF